MSRNTTLTAFAAGVCCVIAASPPAVAMGAVIGSLHAASIAAVRSSTAMPVGRMTIPPIGHILMCKKHPSECTPYDASPLAPGNGAGVERVAYAHGALANAPNSRSSVRRRRSYPPVALTPQAWAELVRVNARVNAEIQPVPDYPATGKKDVWSVSGRKGDCEDYAIRKRHELIRLGWPSHATLIAIGMHPRYGMHAVLTVRTTKGDFVLDNLQKSVMGWNETSYGWVKRQSEGDPRKWVRLGNGSTRFASRRPARPPGKRAGGRIDGNAQLRLRPVAANTPNVRTSASAAFDPQVSKSPVGKQRLAKVGFSAQRHALDLGIAAVWIGVSAKPHPRPRVTPSRRKPAKPRRRAPANRPWFMN